MTRALLAISILALTPALVFADTQPLPMTYEVFEAAVPHFDLDTCPAELDGADVFCRATFQNEEIHVFAFSENDSNPMTGFASYPADGLITLLN